MTSFPRVVITEEGLREGMQIESVSITVEQKLDLLEALSETGLTRIVVGSFVSPKWTPQMKDIEQLVQRIVPRPGVTYLALALNDRGRERMRAYSPPLTIERGVPETHGHMCEVFIKRNTNRTIEEQRATWPVIVQRAAAAGTAAGGIGLSAGWGSNWSGKFTREARFAELQAQHDLWTKAGIPVTSVNLADPMGWNMPDEVAGDLAVITQRWPQVRRFRLHLHNQRGMALTSIYAAMHALSPEHTIDVDSTIGGIGGCPYCGNGRVAGMAPTEDLVQLLEEIGIDTGVDLYKLVDVVWLAERIIGRPLYGHVSNAGPLPRGEHLYRTDMPFIETPEQARHFRLGPATYEGQGLPRPWEPSVAPAAGTTSGIRSAS